MARKQRERYIVTGPGIVDGEEPSYADPGPALSRALSAACDAKRDGPDVTYYARDAITGNILGYAEKLGRGIHIKRN